MEGFGEVKTRRLPHWDLPGAIYFITTCLAGSIPAKGLLDIARLRAALQTGRSQKPTEAKDREIECWKRIFARTDRWLDQEPAVRHFANPVLATVAVGSCYYWAGRRYDLLGYCVMPSHLHWVFRPLDDERQVSNLPHDERQVSNLPHNGRQGKRERSAREKIMHTLKLHTALECNRLLGRSGVFWQDESYDHCVRDMDELERIILYVEQNPVKAGLTEQADLWRWSSAYDRKKMGGFIGEPLMRP